MDPFRKQLTAVDGKKSYSHVDWFNVVTTLLNGKKINNIMYKNLPFFIVLFYKSMGSLVSIYQLYNIKLFNTLVSEVFY